MRFYVLPATTTKSKRITRERFHVCFFVLFWSFFFECVRRFGIDLFRFFLQFSSSRTCFVDRRKRHKKEKREEGISLSLSLALIFAHSPFPPVFWECAIQTRRRRCPLLRPLRPSDDADPQTRRRSQHQIWMMKKMSSRRVTSRNTIARRIVGSSCTIACTT